LEEQGGCFGSSRRGHDHHSLQQVGPLGRPLGFLTVGTSAPVTRAPPEVSS
jgi:hypothetical protein